MPPTNPRREEPARFFSTLNSINEFDKLEIRNMIRGILSPTQRETCFIANYYRAIAAVESILALNHVRHLQAIAAAARSLFEVSVDVALFDRVPRAAEKMTALVDVEKMRSAQAIVAFRNASPDAKVDATIFQQFLDAEAGRITTLRDSLWPGRPDVQHWSLMKMQKRVDTLGSPFNEIYAVEYPRLSWYVHSGLTGVANLSLESLELMAGIAFTIAIDSHKRLLTNIITEFQLSKADSKIRNRLELARMLPWTDNEGQGAQLRRELGL